MKAVIALCLLCLLQVSTAEEEQSLSGGAPGDPAQAVLDREARAPGRKKCKGKNCKRNGNGGKPCKGKNCKRTRNGKKPCKGKKCKRARNGRKPCKGKKCKRKGNRKESNGRNKNKNGKSGDRNTCLLSASVETIRKYSRAVTELNSLRRIFSFRSTMAGKKTNANSTFADSLEAIKEATGDGKSCEGSSSEDDKAKGKEIHDKLANCSMTAAAKCDETAAGATINESALTPCNASLPTFIAAFKTCFTTDQANVCTCVGALAVPADECLDFQTAAKKLKSQKKKCTKGDAAGSFGDCRKQERMAAKYGNKCKKGCGSAAMTTSAPSGRVNFLRQLNHKMLQKMNLN